MIQRVTTVGTGEIVKIDHIEYRLDPVFYFVLKPGIVYNFSKIIKLKVVDEHGKPFPDMLCNYVPYYEVGFTCTGRAKYHQSTEGINCIYRLKSVPDYG